MAFSSSAKPSQFTYKEPDRVVSSRAAGSSAEAAGYVEEKVGDLFSCSPDASLAHCISADVRMGKGIAVLFKKKFGGVEDLRAQAARPGGLAVLRRENRYVYYLVTKAKYSDQPTMETLRSSLEQMREHCRQKKVSHVCMPRIGCGLDRLQWPEVKRLLERTFEGGETKVTVYRLP